MIAYDKPLLDNVYLDEEAYRLKESGFISSEQYQSCKNQLPRLKSQDNLFIRIGFFILGTLLFVSICGLLILLISLPIIFLGAIIGFWVKEFMSREKKYFGYGLDDAFILGAISTLLIAIGISNEQDYYETNYLAIYIAMAIASSFAYLRYLSLSLALTACIGISGSLAYLTLDYCVIGKSILPFVMLFFSGVGYFVSKKMLENLTTPYYYNGLKLTKSFCLILFYLAGNYYVVRELNAQLSDPYYLDNANKVSPEIPFSVFFWVFTFIVPIIYLIFSLKNKDRILLWIGFLALCFSFFSFRMHHHVLPPEVALTLGGLVLFAFTYFAIKKTKHKETGITFQADRFSDPNAFSNLQTIAVASQFGLNSEAKIEESPMDFGGGGFSGGGSGEDF